MTTIAFDMEWTTERIDVLGLAIGEKAAATPCNTGTMAQFLDALRRADRIVGQNVIDADYRQLEREGIDTSAFLPKTFDIRLAMHATHGHLAGTGSYDLRSILLLLGARQGKRFALDWKQYESDLYRTCAMDAASALWAVPTLDRLIAQQRVEPVVQISHRCAPIFALMKEQGVRLDTNVLNTIYTERKQRLEHAVDRYGLWEERGKKVIKKVPIWRSPKVLELYEQKFGVRPKNLQRKTWEGLAKTGPTAEAREFASILVELGKGANDGVWLGKVTESEDGLDFSKIDSKGFIYPRYDICGSPDRAIASNPNCFDSNTEILTRRGWIEFPSLVEEDEVAQWDNKCITFVKPNAITNGMTYTGKMVHVTNTHIDICMTGNHRCLLVSKKGRNRVVEALQYVNQSCKQLNAGYYVGGTGLPLSKDEITVICAMQADGTWGHSANPSLHWKFAKERKIARLTNTLTRLAVPFTNSKRQETTRIEDKVYVTDFTHISVGVGELSSLVYRYLGKEKCFGPWLLDLNREQLDFFCNEIFNWDGNFIKRNGYDSVIEDNADWIQTAFALSNRRARKTRRRSNISKRDAFHIGVSPNAYSMTDNISCSVKYVKNFPVYCVSVPSSFIVVRRNGKVHITGNCQNFPKPSDDPRALPLRSAVLPLHDDHVVLGIDFSSIETLTNAIESDDWDRVQAVQKGRLTHEGTAELLNKTFGLSLTRSMGKVVNHAGDKGESPWNLACRLFQTDRPSRQQVQQCQAIFWRMLQDYPKTAKFRDELWERSIENPLVVQNRFGRRLACFSRAKYGDASERFVKHNPEKKYWCSCGACAPRRDRWKYAIAFLGRSCAFDALLRKMATVWYDKRLDEFSLPILEVHDELDFSVPKDKVEYYAAIVKECFETPVDELGISLPAEVKWGPNWAVAH